MAERPHGESSHLSPDKRRFQNLRAFLYLKSVLGKDEARVLSQSPPIEIKRETERSVSVIYDLPYRFQKLVVKEVYVISAEGLITCRLEMEPRLASGLMYRGKVTIITRIEGEENLLPDRQDSTSTAAKIIADDIKSRIEGRARRDRVL